MSAHTDPSDASGRAPYAWEQPDSGAWALPANSSGTQPATGNWDGAQANGWDRPTTHGWGHPASHGQDTQAHATQGWSQPSTGDTKQLPQAPAPQPQAQDASAAPGSGPPTARGWDQPTTADDQGAQSVARGLGQQQGGWTTQMASALASAVSGSDSSDDEARPSAVPPATQDGVALPVSDAQSTAPPPVQNEPHPPPPYGAAQSTVPAASPVPAKAVAVQQPAQPAPPPAVPNWPRALNGLFFRDSDGDPALRLSSDRIADLEQIEFKIKGEGERTECWDERLTNPETLCDWLRLQAIKPPKVLIHVNGWHKETRTVRTTTQTANGTQHGTRTETYRVPDFRFELALREMYAHEYTRANVQLQVANVNQIPEPKVDDKHWWNDSSSSSSSSDDEKAKPKTTANDGHKASKRSRFKRFFGADSSSSDDDKDKKGDKGKKDTKGNATADANSKPKPAQIDTGNEAAPKALVHSASPSMDTTATLLQWCTAFCADPAKNKCLILSKRTWGWDFERITNRINQVIRDTGYPHISSVSWSFTESYVVVRPPSRSLRVLQRMTNKGSVQYIAAQSCYGMNVYPPLPGTYPGETLDQANGRLPTLQEVYLPPNPTIEQGPGGVHYLLGEREDTWLARWEPKIEAGILGAKRW